MPFTGLATPMSARRPFGAYRGRHSDSVAVQRAEARPQRRASPGPVRPGLLGLARRGDRNAPDHHRARAVRVMSLSHMAGSVVGGALVVKFVPTPFIVVGIAMALSYGAVRLLIWLVRALIERLSRIEVKWPDLGYRAAKARSRHSKPTSRRLRCEPSPRWPRHGIRGQSDRRSGEG